MADNQPGSLYMTTLRLLKDSGKSLPTVYLETGLPFYWLRKFASGDVKDPSVNRIQKLYEYLTGKPLEV